MIRSAWGRFAGILLAAVVVSAAGCDGSNGQARQGTVQAQQGQAQPGPEQAPARPAAMNEPPSKVTIRVLSTNDIHGALSPTMVSEPIGPGKLGGIENLAGMIYQLAMEAPDNTIVVDAGDCFQGEYAANATEGTFCTDYFNVSGYTARTIGNHEFDYLDIGPDKDMKDPRGALKRMLSAAGQPVVLANAHLGDGSPLHPRLAEFAVIDVAGVKVGITGLITPDTPSVSRRAGSADVVFEQPVDALRRVLPKMRAAGADVVVVLTHLTGLCSERHDLYAPGEAPCVVGGELSQIEKAFSNRDIDLIVSGHDHVMLHGDGNSIPILENMSQGIFVGRAEIDVDMAGGRKVSAVRVLDHVPVCIAAAPTPNVCAPAWPGFKGIAEPRRVVRDLRLSIEAAVAAECSDAVATAETDITFPHATEPPAANLAVDLLRELGATGKGAGRKAADFAFMNRGSTRGALAAGPITVCDMARVWPFEDSPVLVLMKGSEIQKMLTYLVDTVDKAPVISGMKVVRRGDGPLRIFDSAGRPISPARMYRVVTTKFLVDGGDRLDAFFKDFPKDRISTLPYETYREGFTRLLREKGTVKAPDTGRWEGVKRD